MKERNWLFDWLPPKLIDLLRKVPRGYGWSGNYASWEQAMVHCGGYQSQVILETVRDACLKVKSGEAAFERDSVLFAEIRYEWPLLAQLMYAAAHGQGRLHVLDFGGALGSTYFQNRKYFEGLSEVRWCVVEQPHFVECGREQFQNEQLRFYPSIEECIRDDAPAVALLSGVLQYLPDPDAVLHSLLQHQFKFILVDRTSFSNDGLDHITVQRVDPDIYQASYPCRFFGRGKFLERFAKDYELVTELAALDRTSYPGHFCGFSFRRKTDAPRTQ